MNTRTGFSGKRKGEILEMPRYFMKDTALAEIERLMMEVPHPSQSNCNEVDDAVQTSIQATIGDQSAKIIYGRKTQKQQMI